MSNQIQLSGDITSNIKEAKEELVLLVKHKKYALYQKIDHEYKRIKAPKSFTFSDFGRDLVAVVDCDSIVIFKISRRGCRGRKGSTGRRGCRGPSGSPGLSGAPGTSGDPGLSGAPGAPGTSGGQGLSGSPGLNGDPGLSGATGAPGTSGDPGLSGAPGSPGLSGDPGLSGAPVAPGKSGDQGLSGSPGVKGDPGLSGAPGAPGSSGGQGVSGTPGINGDPGLSGAPGAQGAPGGQGVSGTPGLNGGPGVSGTPGVNGDPGLSGTPGINGDPGLSGAPGSPGLSGSQGLSGAPGLNGDPGVSGTPGVTTGNAIIPFASGPVPLALNTIAGGLAGTGAILGFGSSLGVAISAIGGFTGFLADMAFTMPRAGTITNISLSLYVTAALSLIGTTIEVDVQMFTLPPGSNLFTALTPVQPIGTLTGTISIGTVVSGNVAISVPVPIGNTVFLYVFITATGLTLINTVTGYASAGVLIA